MDFNPDHLVALLEQDLGTPLGALANFRNDALKKSIVKKYVEVGNKDALHKAALENFSALNTRVSEYLCEPLFVSSDIFKEWKEQLNRSFYSGEMQSPRVTLSGCIDNGACGPGSSLGTKRTGMFFKMFDSHLTTTSDFLYDYYKRNISTRWRAAEEIRAQCYTVKVVPGSKLSSVPKDRTKNRTTCTEPILNMFYQLGAKTQIESMLKTEFNLDLSVQPDFNRALARIGSIDGSLATIDLKDASDSVSVELCSKLLPKALFDLLMKIRSPYAHNGKKLEQLHMISTMGDGFTFALMTWIFVGLIRAIYIHNHDKALMGSNCGVFGDDLIVKTEYVQQLYDSLTQAGFTINKDKSFTEGPFRESCGGDFYLGHDVRGVYIKKIQHETHVYSAFNRLHFWSLEHNVGLYSTLRYLRQFAEFRPVPMSSGVDAGFVVAEENLQCPKLDKNRSVIFHGLKSCPAQITKCGERFINHHGGLIAFLGGYVRNDVMNERSNQPSFRVARQITFNWDDMMYPLRDEYVQVRKEIRPNISARELGRSWNLL